MKQTRSIFIIALIVIGICFSAGPVFAAGQSEKGTAEGVTTLKVYNNPAPGEPDPNTGIELQALGEITKEYEDNNPNVRIEWVVQPWTTEQDMRTWHLTQMQAGSAPDLMSTQPNWIREDLGKDWWVCVDPFLAEPSPHHPGYDTWEDAFYPNLDIWTLADGKRYSIQTTQVQVLFYYNKDLINKLGLNGEPDTWTDFMSNAKKIDADGTTPFAWNLSDLNQLTWTSGWFTTFVMRNRLPEFDKNSDGLVHDYELAKTILDGDFKATDAEYKECMKIMDKMAQYWSEGAIGASRPTTYREWLTQDAGYFLDGTWNFFGVTQDPLREFDFGVSYFPRLTSEASDFITRDDIPLNNKGAGYGDNWGIPTLTEERGTLEQAVDFLQWLTKPENMTRHCKEAYRLPNIKGATGHELLDDVVPTLGYEMYPFEEEDVWLTIEYGTKYLQYWQDIFNDDLTIDAAAEKMQKDIWQAATKVWEIHEEATQ